MLLGILIDSYRFFDRRWLQITIAAIFCAAITEAIVLGTDHFMTSALITLKDVNNDTIPVSYSDIARAILLEIFKVWFDCFLLLLLKKEIEKTPVKTASTVLDSLKIYPRVLLYYLVSRLLIVPSLAATFLATATDPTGLMSLVPLISALVLFVWFSLIIPVAILDNTTGILASLSRSRYLVSKYFWVVSLLILLGSFPTIAMIDVSLKSSYAQAVGLFLSFASMIIESLTIMFAYVHLRIAKGEAIVLKENESSEAKEAPEASAEEEANIMPGENDKTEDTEDNNIAAK